VNIEKYEKTINGESIIDLFKKVRAFYPTKGVIKLILDDAGYHRSVEVEKAVEKENIKLRYILQYSPNLNPIGRFWKVMNEHARNGKYFATTKEFRQSIDDFFKTLPSIANTLDSWINGSFQTLTLAF